MVIQLLNKDGSQLGKRMLSYNSYLKQKDQGLHEYKEPNPEDLKISVVKTKLNSKIAINERVKEIRNKYIPNAISMHKLGIQYNTTHRTVSKIINNQAYQNVY